MAWGWNWKLCVVSFSGVWVGPKYICLQEIHFFKMLSFNFFLSKQPEKCQAWSFLDWGPRTSYGSPHEGNTLVSLTQANCCTVSPFSSAFAHPLCTSALSASRAVFRPPLPICRRHVMPSFLQRSSHVGRNTGPEEQFCWCDSQISEPTGMFLCPPQFSSLPGSILLSKHTLYF